MFYPQTIIFPKWARSLLARQQERILTVFGVITKGRFINK
jgi:hypothetical protein